MTTPVADQTSPASGPSADAPPPRRRSLSLAAVLRPIRSGNTFEEAVARILQAIKLGAVMRGERLPAERELAKQLGISRVTLRQALHTLTEAGYVESRRGRSGGTFVLYAPDSHHSDEEIDTEALAEVLEDTLVMRAAIEPGAAGVAAECNLGPALRTYLSERLDEVAETETSRAHRLSDARLHLAIAEVTESTSLVIAVADVQMTLASLLEAVPSRPVNIDHSHDQHDKIVSAILDGRADAARRHMREHVDATAALLRGFLG